MIFGLKIILPHGVRCLPTYDNNLIVLQPFAGLFLVLSTTVGMLIALKIFYKSVKSCQELEHYFSFKTLSKYTLLHDRL